MVYSQDGKAYHIKVDKEMIGEYVILPGDPGRCASIAKYLEDSELVASNREYVTYTGRIGDTKVSVTSTGIGGPSAAIALEELVASGAHTFVRVGTCGGMQKEIKGGDIVIATSAVRMEGTTKEYAPIEYPAVADFDVALALRESADELGLTSFTGVVQSKDSFYGQHLKDEMPVSYELSGKWEAWKRMGCLASEMEAASLFIVGGFRRVRVGACFLVVANQEREALGLDNPQVFDTDAAVRLAVSAIKNLIEKDKKMNN